MMKRNPYIRLYISIICCAAFFLASLIAGNRLEDGVTVCNAEKIEKALHKIQREIQREIDVMLADTVERFGLSDELHSQGVDLFVVDSAGIVYWSDNLPVKYGELLKVSEKAEYRFTGNGWYIVKSFKHGVYSFVTLILVKREYYYENQFLQNGVNPAFNFPNNVIIQQLGSDIGVAVRGNDGAPLFVVNTDVSRINGGFSGIAASGVTLLLRWLAVACACFALMFVFCTRTLYRRSLKWLLCVPVVLAGLRLLLFFNRRFSCGDLYLFSPQLYGDSDFLPSLGDLLLHVLFVFMFVVTLFRAKDVLKERLALRTGGWKLCAYYFSWLLMALLLCGVQYITVSLVDNSEITFKIFKMNDITQYSFLAYFIVGVMLAQVFTVQYIQTQLFVGVNTFWRFIAGNAIVFAILTVALQFKYLHLAVFAMFLFSGILFLRRQFVRLPWSVFVWLTALASFYVSLALIVSADGREHRNRMLLAQRLLFYESDPVAEMLLKDIERKLLHDPYIRDILNSENFSQTDIYEILSDRYFKGYFQRYDLRPMVCTPDKQLHITEEDKEINCFDFFADERENQGMPLPGSSHFRLMNSYWGRIFYFGYFKIPGEKNVTLFIELYSKPEVEAIGYPELLKIESKDIDFQFKDYSYAKYSNDKRVTKSGDFDYTFELPDKHRQNGFYSSDGYSHYMYSDDENNAVIISAVEMDFFDCVSMFSYSFAIVIIVLFVIFSLTGLKPEIIKSKHSYRWKISLVILVCLISALTSVTGAMLAYAINQSDRKNIDAIHGKMQSIIIELDQDLFYRESITPEMLSMLENTLIKLSNAFYTDLNLYDSSGDLIISSRNEIFEKNLLGKKMNHDAFEALSSDKQAKYIHTEHIGTLNYFSSYATYYNSEGKALAYINLPHFYRPSELRNELLTLIGSVLSIYIFLIITGIALSVFVSDQITRPLDLVRREMSKVNLAEQPEPIDYNADNELGALVGEYNRMIAELAQSARILAENERESAWREMARQIAHEIKNPLTPMKLNIQLAMRMKERRDEGWQDKMNEAMKSILEQIDILSSTASEFSDFARTGKAQCEPVDLAQSIKSGLALFAGYSINFTRNPTENYFVKANREQLQRVLTNFIKNSIQATENVVAPEIDIALLTDDNSYVVSISDNGVGISEEAEKNLFRPNFTTKSGGTGLGLAISKGIIESFGGTVVFVRREQGACFEIRLPVMEWKL